MEASNGCCEGNGKTAPGGNGGRQATKLVRDPRVWLFLVELGFANGNASEAARAVGWDESKGGRLIAEHPELRELASQAVARQARVQYQEWVDMHARARQRIGELMESPDDRVALAAAEIVIERVEGKVTQPIRDDGPPPITLNDVTMRYVTALHMTRDMSIAEALACAERNQEEVEEWGRAHGLIARAQP